MYKSLEFGDEFLAQGLHLNIKICIHGSSQTCSLEGCVCVCVCVCTYIYIYIYIYISGGPLSALTCCVNVRLLSGDKKNIAVNLFSKLGWELGLYYASYDDFHPDILARMYT